MKPGRLSKLRGGAALPPREPLIHVAAAYLSGFCAIAAVALLTDALQVPLVLGSFGATCVLVFGFPKVPFSQPRNVIVGHVLSSLIGLVFLTAFGAAWWSMALALATAVAAMLVTRTVHPPAGSNPVIVMLSHPTWTFLLTPTLYGAALITLIAVLLNNIGATRRYPTYWVGRSPERDARSQRSARFEPNPVDPTNQAKE
ncbi:MAG TPA: HPP family protein [Kofleriaceae bacterium]